MFVMSPAPIIPEQLAALPPEFRAILEAVIGHYEQRIAALEARIAVLEAENAALKKTPRNSSAPASTEHPHAKPAPRREKSQKKTGGQPGHPTFERSLILTEQREKVVP